MSPDPERAPRDEGSETLDLRILTPGLTEEEIAAVTSVVAAMLEEQRDAAERGTAAPAAHWRRSLDGHGTAARGPAAWRWSVQLN